MQSRAWLHVFRSSSEPGSESAVARGMVWLEAPHALVPETADNKRL